MINKQEIINIFKEKKIKLTPQRLAIIDFLSKKEGHYSAEDIYTTLKQDFPYMSFSTVYNTLKTLSELHLVEELYLLDKKVVFDTNTTPHFHFLCTRCGKIYDVISDECFDLKKCETVFPGHLIEKTHIYMYGVCKECMKKEKNKSN